MNDLMTMLATPPRALPWPLAVVSLGFAASFGAAWGSFLNVVIARVPKGESVVHPRSRCPVCGQGISARDNIPVVSWLLLRGKCRGCKTPIAARYPLVELIGGFCGAAIVARCGMSVTALELFSFAMILTAIAFIDIDTYTVPTSLIVALMITAAFGATVDAQPALPWLERAIGAAAGYGVLGLVIVIFTGIFRRTGRIPKDEWAMGWGDPLILMGIGAVIGWRQLPLVVFLASLQGSIIGIALKLVGRKEGAPVSDTDPWVPPKDSVPFGPFLALGALEAAFFGREFLDRFAPLLWPGLF
jgi:leader peptidase (prepilin peptidase) / N-methyltransferase